MKSLFLRLSVLLFLAYPALANDPFTANKTASPIIVNNDFLPVEEAFIPDHRIEGNQLLLHWQIADAYYLYEERFKFALVDKTRLEASYTPGKMKYDEIFGRETSVHYGQVTVTIDLSPFKDAFALKLEYQGCADAGLCYPPQKVNLWIDIPNGKVTPATAEQLQNPASLTNESPTPVPTDLDYESGFVWQAILFALLGGMILNLMPCVFPVLSLKVMHLAGPNRQHLVSHGWVYTLGIVASFIGFALILLLARKGGEAIGWGFQLQSPGLVAALAYLFFVMGLSLSGLLNIGTSFMGTGQNLAAKSGYTGSFFTGVLAAVVASPCTAPFMGTALGFALTQPYYVSLIVFASLGLGMAIPLLLLCYIPALINRLPQPGQWMETLKQFLAFPIYIAAVWLLWVYGRQTGSTSMAALVIGAVFLAFACWLTTLYLNDWKIWLRRILILLSIAAAFYIPWNQSQKDGESSRWQAWSPEAVEELRAEGRPVFVDFTADWCITCLANEKAVLETAEIEAAFDQLNVATLKGDWTNSDPKITAILQEYGRSGVPLYLYYSPGSEGKAEVLPQILTKDIVLTALGSK